MKAKLVKENLSEGSFLEDDYEDYGDELSDYSWEVGKYISDNMENYYEEDLGDELGDALYDVMGKILKCMKSGMNVKECAEMLMDDEKFMENFKIDENCN